MQIVGGGNSHVYDAADEGPHRPGPQELWQESVVLVWWDLASRVGGFYRIGHETNWKTGPMVALWSNTITPEGIHHKTAYLPLRDQDRLENGFGSGDGTVRFEHDGRHAIWTLDEGDLLRARLVAEDFHCGLDCYPKSGAISEFAPHHLEVSSRVKGELKAKGRTYAVDALAFRDHGWGERAWHTLLSHRWVVGTFDDGFSFCAIAWQSTDGVLIRFGWIVRGGQVIHAKEVDIVAHVECDAVCIRGGKVRMTLTTGEVVDLGFEAVARTTVSFHHGIACADTLCRATCGGRVGVADFEATHNAQGGRNRPGKLLDGIVENGWHPA